MADILIRGMDKPFNCFACDLSRLSGERLFCCVTKDEVLRSKIAPECPIQELPPHGDLIDMDDLQTERIVIRGTVGYIAHAIQNAPVVIPSNKEDDE